MKPQKNSCLGTFLPANSSWGKCFIVVRYFVDFFVVISNVKFNLLQ